MNHLEEIEHRKALMARIYKHEKLSPDERLWLKTHPVYDWHLGYPYLKADILSLEPKRPYRIHIRIEHLTYEKQIFPIICVPTGKGAIHTEFPIKDFYGNSKLGKPVKALGLTVDKVRQSTSVRCHADIGLLMVTYMCYYYDEKHQMILADTSDSGSVRLAMLKEVISENKVLYRCKSPISDSFGSLVFTVEWEPLTV